MNLKLKLITLTGVIFFSFSTLKAQTTNQTFAPSHLKAAEQVMLATGINMQFGGMINTMIDQLSGQVPADKRDGFIKVMKTFMGKYFTWDLLKDKMAVIYASEFTEDELNQLTAFYNSPIGKKASSKMTVLMQRGMQVGQEAVAAHKDELQQMMQDEFAEKTDPPAVKEQVSPATKKPASKAPVKH
ncbi:DUF2059 domain-containing protein [Mucilaginibacter angelicae]|uniref:DUF2059 domain-containing protein n=1 Tax=Mucilaginibacter angelicae TaxID=869718 RepID=A0ABV6LB02_9SPHI